MKKSVVGRSFDLATFTGEFEKRANSSRQFAYRSQKRDPGYDTVRTSIQERLCNELEIRYIRGGLGRVSGLAGSPGSLGSRGAAFSELDKALGTQRRGSKLVIVRRYAPSRPSTSAVDTPDEGRLSCCFLLQQITVPRHAGWSWAARPPP